MRACSGGVILSFMSGKQIELNYKEYKELEDFFIKDGNVMKSAWPPCHQKPNITVKQGEAVMNDPQFDHNFVPPPGYNDEYYEGRR